MIQGFCGRRLFACLRLGERGDSRREEGNQIFWGKEDLAASLSGADADCIVFLAGALDVGRERFFHADWRAAAADVAGEREQIFHVHHGDAFVSGDARRGLEVELFFRRQAKDDGARLVADCDDGFENAIGIKAQDFGGMDAGEVLFAVFVGFCFVRNFGRIQNAHDIGFLFFRHFIFLFFLARQRWEMGDER